MVNTTTENTLDASRNYQRRSSQTDMGIRSKQGARDDKLRYTFSTTQENGTDRVQVKQAILQKRSSSPRDSRTLQNISRENSSSYLRMRQNSVHNKSK